MKNQENIISNYEKSLINSREEFAKIPIVLFENRDPVFWYIFLANYSKQGIYMTDMVPDWIRRAGQKTSKIGFTKIGDSLSKHASHEEDHHLMYENDLQTLFEQFNKKFPKLCRLESCLENTMLPAVVEYRKFHEDVIASNSPYQQIAIEYEIEQLSVSSGELFISHMMRVCGPEISEALTFAKDHVALDIGHTKYNRALIADAIETIPNAEVALINAGKNVLRIYSEYMNELFKVTKSMFKKAQLDKLNNKE